MKKCEGKAPILVRAALAHSETVLGALDPSWALIASSQGVSASGVFRNDSGLVRKSEPQDNHFRRHRTFF